MIPDQLNQETHLLEYEPGTYGDFVSGIISYAVEGFIDPCNSEYTNDERYWNANDAVVARNRYPLSLRGGGYEHVEHYTEFMIAHHIFIHYNGFLHIDELQNRKLLFNTHSYIRDLLKFRTTHNKFTKTKTKCLTIDDDFDIIFRSVCNEYFTSHPNYNDIEWEDFKTMFCNRVTKIRQIEQHVPKELTLDIHDIDGVTPDSISSYGDVDVDRFDEYFSEYRKFKLDKLDTIAKRTYKIFFENDKDRMQQYVRLYDTTCT